MHVLISSSDLLHMKVTRFVLEEAGVQVGQVADADKLVPRLTREHIDLLLLDTYLQGVNSFELCREIRSQYNMPIIFVASDATIGARVQALKLGADDYIAKPFDGQELLARIEAVMRRYGEDFSPCYTPISVGPIHLDPLVRRVEMQGTQSAVLTAREFQLLYYLVQNARSILSSHQIYQRIWGLDYGIDSNLVPVYIGRLRRKIEKDPTHPQHIVYVRDLGYCFKP